ncbi:MAG: hypothetical protein UT61_C0051G0005 [Candidatus Woesebacteria bacterium GW2011_GWA1_39_8]|uniref:Uncharacterized protein n=1 Tax=Candidatus Woesebacteria bacterium GW2011_GWA1_39_8 TaxID=1618552 RepID=A0A0G0PKE0_9BACT|nr:MAG: hypothetical protein UT61_C0051G0005 [Candidatus Woesebacteria bacterium GW2011_GWA1_39_8]
MQLYNMGQRPLSEGLRNYLVGQLPDAPSEDILNQIKEKMEKEGIAEKFDQLCFSKIPGIKDYYDHSGYPKFYVDWSISLNNFISEESKVILGIHGIQIEMQAQLRVVVKPPNKLSVLPHFAEEPYYQPAHWYYCLPSEVEKLRRIALARAFSPFDQMSTIDFTKPPDEPFAKIPSPLRSLQDVEEWLEGKEWSDGT